MPVTYLPLDRFRARSLAAPAIRVVLHPAAGAGMPAGRVIARPAVSMT